MLDSYLSAHVWILALVILALFGLELRRELRELRRRPELFTYDRRAGAYRRARKGETCE